MEFGSNCRQNSSGDEIANVNLFTTISQMYSKKTTKKESTSFSKLNDS